MLCSACASAGNGDSVIAIPGVAVGFGSGAAGFASPLEGFAAGVGGGAPRLPCCASAWVGAVAETTPKRHKKTANFETGKDRAEIMTRILHTNPAISHNPNKYFCILTREVDWRFVLCAARSPWSLFASSLFRPSP